MKTMPSSINHHGGARSGYSLIELMAVMAILGVVTALAAPGLAAVTRGTYLSYAARMVHDQLSLARQVALSRNLPVEVRLYKYEESRMPNDPAGGSYRAMQLFLAEDSGAFTPVSQVVRLPDSVIVDSSNALSSIIGQAGATATAPRLAAGADLAFPLPAVNTNYTAVVFRYLPDGSTNMSAGGQWFLTMHEGKFGDNLSAPPSSFYTLQIEASNGRMRNYQP